MWLYVWVRVDVFESMKWHDVMEYNTVIITYLMGYQ